MTGLSKDQLSLLPQVLLEEIPNNEDLAALGIILLITAACRSGDTLLESEDYFKFLAIKGHDKIKATWGKIKERQNDR